MPWVWLVLPLNVPRSLFVFMQAVGPVAVTSLLLGNVQHGLGNLAGVSFPASVLDPATNLTVPYNPSSPGAFAPQQDAYNNAAHNVSPCLAPLRLRIC